MNAGHEILPSIQWEHDGNRLRCVDCYEESSSYTELQSHQTARSIETCRYCFKSLGYSCACKHEPRVHREEFELPLDHHLCHFRCGLFSEAQLTNHQNQEHRLCGKYRSIVFVGDWTAVAPDFVNHLNLCCGAGPPRAKLMEKDLIEALCDVHSRLSSHSGASTSEQREDSSKHSRKTPEINPWLIREQNSNIIHIPASPYMRLRFELNPNRSTNAGTKSRATYLGTTPEQKLAHGAIVSTSPGQIVQQPMSENALFCKESKQPEPEATVTEVSMPTKKITIADARRAADSIGQVTTDIILKQQGYIGKLERDNSQLGRLLQDLETIRNERDDLSSTKQSLEQEVRRLKEETALSEEKYNNLHSRYEKQKTRYEKHKRLFLDDRDYWEDSMESAPEQHH